MNKTMIRIVIAILCAMLILGILAGPLSALAAETQRFGYETLDKDQKYVYVNLLTGVAKLSEKIELKQSKKISKEDLRIANNAFCSDYPEYFWYVGSYTYTLVNDKYITQIRPDYTLGGEKVSANDGGFVAAKSAFADKAYQILQGMTAQTDYDKALYLHDYLVENVVYTSGSDDQTAYGALVGGKAVCAGYTRAYQFLLNLAGIDCWKVDGTAVNAQGQPEEHSWNVLWLDGKCYYTDVTWDDPGNVVSHAYFCRSLAEISLDHIAEAHFTKLLPECAHDPVDYFVLKSGEGSGVAVLADMDAGANVAKYFTVAEQADGSSVFTCNFWYVGKDFNAWLSTNQEDLARALNLEGTFHCSGVTVGKEYQLQITGTVKQPEPTQPDLDFSLDFELDLSGILPVLFGVGGGIILLAIILIIILRKKK